MDAIPVSAEEIAQDYMYRRAAIVKALTRDAENFYAQCDPAKDHLCLYGEINENWRVDSPVEEVPPELPEPTLGINFARDGMDYTNWLTLVAVHSDAWLYSVAFYYAARLNKLERQRLFDMINERPTCYEALVNSLKEKTKSKKKKTKTSSRRKKEEEEEEVEEEEEEDEEEDDENTFCGICAAAYSKSQFWIGCDKCQKWYHGSCVKMTASKAANIPSYHCPSCVKKRSRS